MEAEFGVYSKGQLAGKLERSRTGGRFVYAEDWEGRGVAYQLPASSEPYETAHIPSLPTFFVNLLPEGTVLRRLSRRAKVAESDLVGMLGLLAEDAVGDVTVRSSDPRRLRLTAGIPFGEAYQRMLEDPRLPLPIDAIAGVQPKISADRITLPYGVKAGPGAFLKITTDDRFPRAVENEAFFMATAADCGLPTARVQRVVDVAGESALLVHRFDRVGRRPVRQLHQEDALQLLDLYPLDKYSTTVEEVGESIRKVVASWPQAGTALVLQLAFGYLIGNHDQHAKNISVLEGKGNLMGLSPIYDMLCTLVYGDQSLALKLNGNDEELTRADFIALADTFGIRREPVLRRLDLMLDKARPWLDRLDEIGFEPLLTGRLRGALLERHAALSA
ncbi:type II toxin-antitoxin system HipA family toxin [bacterium]|nr:MAG: type II toxin-antitoxin system HipA family toxin [bacterium]